MGWRPFGAKPFATVMPMWVGRHTWGVFHATIALPWRYCLYHDIFWITKCIVFAFSAIYFFNITCVNSETRKHHPSIELSKSARQNHFDRGGGGGGAFRFSTIFCLQQIKLWVHTWRRYDMETFSALLTLCDGHHLSPEDSHYKGTGMLRCDVPCG